MLYNLQNKKTVLDQIKLDAVEAVNLETKVDYITEKYNKCEEESLEGKIKIAEAITNKGIETLSTDSWDTIASNIDSIDQGNPYLRWNESTGFIEVMDEGGDWHSVSTKKYEYLPISKVQSASGNVKVGANATNSTTILCESGGPITLKFEISYGGTYMNMSYLSISVSKNNENIFSGTPSSSSYTWNFNVLSGDKIVISIKNTAQTSNNYGNISYSYQIN
jgi:hypothetical protein